METRGFSLLELIVVLVVTAVLAAVIAIPTYQRVHQRSQDTTAEAGLAVLFRQAQAVAGFRGDARFTNDDFAAAIADLHATTPGVHAADLTVHVGESAQTAGDGEYAYGVDGGGLTATVTVDRPHDRCSYATGASTGAPVTWTTAGDACTVATGLGGPGTAPSGGGSGGGPLAAPDTPVGVAVAATGGTVALTWDPVAEADDYQILRDGSATGTSVTESFAISSTAGMAEFQVVARNSGGSSAPSTPVRAVVADSSVAGVGIIEALGVAAGGGTFTNPQRAGWLRAWGTYDGSVPQTDNSSSTFTNTAGYGGHSYIYDFGPDTTVSVTGYSLQAPASPAAYPRTWQLHGSIDGSAWTLLDGRSGDATLSTPSQWGTWPTSNTDGWRYVRLHNNGTSSNGRWDFQVGEIEFYGAAGRNGFVAGPGTTHQLVFATGGDANGLFAHLGGAGSGGYENPATTGMIRADGTYDAPGNQIDRNPATMTNTAGYGGHSYVYDLGSQRRFRPAFYTLQTGASPAAHPRTWQLQGSQDGVTWTTLDSRSDERSLHSNSQWGGWHVPTGTAWRYLRIHNNGASSNGRWDFQIAEVEFYGDLLETARPAPTAGTTRLVFDGWGGTGGMFATLGNASGGYVNPTRNGDVIPFGTYDQPHNNSDRNPATMTNAAGYGRHSYTWDLGPNRRLVVHRYAIQAPNSPAAYPRTWQLQGSNDGSTWTTLWNHSSDNTLRSPAQWASWQPENTTGWRMLRILNNGVSSNGRWDFQLGEVEFYGDLTVTAPPAVPSGSTRIAFNGWGGTSGLFATLGNAASGNYVNPTTNGTITATGTYDQPHNQSDRTADTRTNTAGYGGHSYTWDLGPTRTITLDRYAIQAPTTVQAYPRRWKLQASNDGTTWTTVSDHVGDGTLGSPGQWGSWSVFDTSSWRYLRLLNDGTSSNGRWDFQIGEIEFYGVLNG